MIFHAPFLILSLRFVIPSVFLMGSSTSFWLFITLARIASLPFGRKAYRYFDQRLLSSMMGMFGYFFESWSGVEYCFYGDELPQNPENVLYISNHQCTVDWIIAETLCLKQSGHGGRIRYLMKKSILYIPLYGWYLNTRDNIFLKRNNLKDNEWLRRKLLKLQSDNTPLWLVVFPEGTRFDPEKSEKIERSHKFAESLGLPKLEHVLTPHTTGFEVILDVNKDLFKAIYDVTIIYEGREGHSVRSRSPNMFGSCQKIHIVLKCIQMSAVPDNISGRKQWLFERFQEKDKIIKNFMSSGKLPEPRRSLPLSFSYSLPPTIIYGTLLLLMASTKTGRAIWLSTLVVYSLLGYFFIHQ